jgi:hypothetical protein
MARRKHFKLKELLTPEQRAQVELLFNNGATLDAILDFITEQGVEIGRSSVHRYFTDFDKRLEIIAATRQKVMALTDAAEGMPPTEVLDAGFQIAAHTMFEALIDTEKFKVGEKDFFNASMALQKLMSGMATSEKLKLQFTKGVAAAVAQIKAEMTKALDGYPEIKKKLGEIADEVAAKLAKPPAPVTRAHEGRGKDE